MKLTDYFQKIYIINLPSRSDRRREMEAQLLSVGLEAGKDGVEFFPAIRPECAGGFPSIGARGCFFSHLEVLRDANTLGLERVLVLEDDLDFSPDFQDRSKAVLQKLGEIPWGVFYGGYELQGATILKEDGLMAVTSDKAIVTAHFVGFNAAAIKQLVPYLERMLERQPGDPRGGPMHVDGAYSWFRKESPDVLTVVAVPELGYQRSSRTDIHDLRWFDRMLVVRDFAGMGRRLKRKIKRLFEK